MARQARLANGTVLEFPDGTPDDVMDRAVADHVNPQQIGPQRSDMYQAVQGAMDTVVGAGDIALSGARGTVNYLSRNAAGAAQGITDKLRGGSFNEGYAVGKDNESRRIAAGGGLVKEEGLRTPQGAKLAQQIGNIPIGLPAQGGPNVGQVPRVSDIGRVVDNAGDYLEEVGGAPLRDAVGSVATLATLKGPGPKPVGAGADAIGNARKAGFIVPPETPAGRLPGGKQAYSGTLVDRMAAGAGRSTGVDDAIAVRNQVMTDRYAARAYGGEEFPTPAGVKQATDESNRAIEELKKLNMPVNLGTALPQGQFAQRVAQLDQRVAGFPNQKPNPAIADLQHDLMTGVPNVENIVDKMRDLRQRSFSHRQSDDVAMNELGKAELKAAIILEDVIDGFLTKAGQTSGNPALANIFKRLLTEYQAARAKLSVLHDVRSAMNPTTGTIDASKIASIDTHALHPDLQTVADAYNSIGSHGMRNVERAARGAAIPVTWGDVAMAAPAAATGALSTGGSPTWTAIAALVPKAIQLMGRQYALRGQGTRNVQSVLKGGMRTSALGIAGGVHLDEGDRP